MKIAFRVDASDTIGSGHLMRCLTLATILQRKDVSSTFIVQKCPGNQIDLIRKKGFQAHEIQQITKQAIATNNDKPHVKKYNWEFDSDQTAKILYGLEPSWLVVDHYALDSRWEENQKKYVRKIMVIDDLANRKHDSDILLDQNLYPNTDNRYEQMVSKKCKKLLGIQYALLQPEYNELRSQVKISDNKIKNIFMYFGNTEANNIIIRIMNIFIGLNREDIKLNIVLPDNSGQKEIIAERLKLHPNISLFGQQKSLASLILKADLAIGGGGATTWERLCLGLPSVVITVADNQRECANYVSKLGLINLIGDITTINDETIKKELEILLNKSNLTNWSKRCFDYFDGNGAARVADILVNS